jgi:hypothetical protein
MDFIDLSILASSLTASQPLPPSDWSSKPQRPAADHRPYGGEGSMEITTFNMETGRWEAQVIEWRSGRET